MPLLDDKFWRDIQQGLTDAGNRGIVGGTLGAPVDLAAGVINAALMSGGYLGNKLGLLTADQMPQPIEHPVGGSEWLGQKMQDAGMVSENRNPVAETLVGLLGPSAINKGGQAAWAMEQNAAKPSLLNDAVRGQLGAIVYHGSPHKFDAFDMSKIGTGEGAQAYGHGMYFAENPEVAKSYRQTEGGYKRVTGGMSNKQEFVADHLSQGRPEMNILEMYAQKYGGTFDDAMKDLIEVKQMYGTGHTYKVDLPDEHIARMLDWDKPLKDQPSAIEAFRVVREAAGMGNEYWKPGKLATGNIEYGKLVSKVGAAKASALLREAGIPGIRYFDGVSRAKGEGSYNYVVFDDQLPQIIGKE